MPLRVTFNGGEGTDEIRYQRDTIIGIFFADVVVDLQRGLLRDINPQKIVDRRAINFENARVLN